MDKRVVITGMGAVTPIGHSVEETWQGIRDGACGIAEITHFDTTNEKCHMGAEVKDWAYPDKRAAKRLDLVNQYANVAAEEAMLQSGIVSGENVDPERFGIIAASGIGGVKTLEDQIVKATVKDTTRFVSALMVPMLIINMVGGNLAIKYQAKNSCLGLATACASGTHGIGEAYRMIKHGYADVMIGGGAARAMKMAIEEAGIAPEDIDYINAHGTGTPLNDLSETRAIKLAFGDDTKVPVSSTKGNIGHLLGAAGSVEAILCLKAIEDGFIPPTINLEKPDPELTLDYVPNEGRKANLTYTMSNSLGFGGHNGTLIIKKFED